MRPSTRSNIGLDPAPSNPVTGQLYYDRSVQQLMVFDGAMWFPVGEDIGYCILCGAADWSHESSGMKADHPFIGNNLELLEWKAEDKNV